jgi:threonine dehydrogenase-like Zn-dependent dehydrogenase
LKSTYAGSLTMDAAALVVDEINLVGSRCGPFAPALRLLAEKRVRVAPMIAGRFVLDEAVAAMAHAEERGVLKVLLDVEAA